MSEEKVIVKVSFEDYEKKAITWARDYANDVAFEERMIYESSPRRFCIIGIYKQFLKNKKLERIELLNEEMKRNIYEDSKRIFPQDMTPDLRRQLCIFIYFMNFIFEKYLS